MPCIFCDLIPPEQRLFDTNSFFCVFDIDPVQIGHLLIISKNHYENITDLPKSELHELIDLEQQLITLIEKNFDVLGVTVVQNNGRVMDEGTHFHVHLIPRYRDDDFWENQTVIPHLLNQEKLKILLKKLAS